MRKSTYISIVICYCYVREVQLQYFEIKKKILLSSRDGTYFVLDITLLQICKLCDVLIVLLALSDSYC